MTKEQFERLQEFEGSLYTAKAFSFVRGLDSVKRETLADIYKEVFQKESQIKSGCSSCVIKGLKELAFKYYEYKESLEAELKRQELIKELDKKPATKTNNSTTKKTNNKPKSKK